MPTLVEPNLLLFAQSFLLFFFMQLCQNLLVLWFWNHSTITYFIPKVFDAVEIRVMYCSSIPNSSIMHLWTLLLCTRNRNRPQKHRILQQAVKGRFRLNANLMGFTSDCLFNWSRIHPVHHQWGWSEAILEFTLRLEQQLLQKVLMKISGETNYIFSRASPWLTQVSSSVPSCQSRDVLSLQVCALMF